MEKTTAFITEEGDGGQEREVLLDSSNGSNGSGNGDHKHRHKTSSSFGGDEKGIFEFFGWVYHIGVNSIGHEYCHLRFLLIKGKYVMMYKRDPHENPGIKPIRKGVIGPTLMVEELGRRKVNDGDFYVIQFYNRLNESKKGEIACSSAGEARKWMEAFDHAKQQAEYELSRGGSTRNKLSMETDIDLEHRPRVKRYAHGLKKLIRIGKGPEMLLRKTSNLGGYGTSDGYFEGQFGDAIEAHEWKCVRTINGIRILEDVADSKNGKAALVKAVALVDASADTVFEVILNLDRRKRYEWDTVTADLELIDSYDGHYDAVYGIYDPKYLTQWKSKRDFVFTRQWFRGQDGTYTILQLPAVHKKRPSRSGYKRTTINPSTWEIRSLNAPMGSNIAKCLITHMLEFHTDGWLPWKKNSCSKFENTIPYTLLSQVAGLKEYIGANPSLSYESSSTVFQSKLSDVSTSNSDFEDSDGQDEFYDAIAGGSSSSSEDEESEDDPDKKGRKIKLKNVSWAISSLALKRSSAPDVNKELDPSVPPFHFDPSQFNGSLCKGKDETDSNCWTSPSGRGFMIRGKTYLRDSAKVMGSDPLLTLLAVDWFKVDKATDKIALHPRCLVQTDAGKKLPFILVINLEVPAKPNYSLVLYYASDRPVNKNSLLGRFVDGTDMFRDARFKLIPSIVEGYWIVKRAVGTKACLLGKAVTCKYFRLDNFLEIDVDIGSSSVARSVIGLVLGYVTSLVVDLAILIEAKEESELPEYILGTVRLNRVKPESAVPLND
ncbi:leucine-rich repeat receptor-like protein kinase TDR-like [Hibiscus syriacus]|uniref:Leucine-rich repeat receptor-like protein kinase TDR-like n=1 Tax=Hibiscus syriacus TaxID=106335 RepID=A0A6A2Y0D1_HIBSY|nr:protein ENHANCED DISEASE RESISTANCE 2-like [Hibiscus syriacus]KAE8668556.1 leucine-rich repeat receptor-like protein kinase TDR-like [Hibiscus syriacus]